jgi:CheY-like chemotaxis protein
MIESTASKLARVIVIDDTRAIHDDFRKILCGTRGQECELDAAEFSMFGVVEKPRLGAAFEMDSAYQGQEGLALITRALAEKRPYAMAFVDIRMPPGWDGIETISRIWEVYPDLQVVVCTAYSDYSWDQMIDRLGYSDKLLILKKPFDNVEVLQLATAFAEKWRLLQDSRRLEEIVGQRTKKLEEMVARLKAELAGK